MYRLPVVVVLLDCRLRGLFLQMKVLSWVYSYFLPVASLLGLFLWLVPAFL
jgi:hypothetical protein